MDFMEWFVRVFACETCMESYGLLVPKKNRFGNNPIERGTTILYVISFAELLVLITN